MTIFYEPLAKVYKAANIADSISDFQGFINDLIKTVEFAEEANLTDPQRTVQLFVDLVGRHEDSFYHFVHSVHAKGEGLFDNLMAWIELFINFVRDGLPSSVSLDFLLPVGGTEREEVLAEVDAIVEYHRKLKLAHHERMKKRLVKGDDLDKDVDAAFVAGVMQNLNLDGVMSDVHDVEAEESEDEADAYSSSEEESVDAPEADEAPQQAGGPGEPAVPVRQGRKKDRVQIDPPRLHHIPQLVPVFVELVSRVSCMFLPREPSLIDSDRARTGSQRARRGPAEKDWLADRRTLMIDGPCRALPVDRFLVVRKGSRCLQMGFLFPSRCSVEAVTDARFTSLRCAP